MDVESTLLRTMRWISWVVATCLGGLGILAVCASFRIPDCGVDAFLMLSSATVLHFGTPRPPPSARPGPPLRESALIALQQAACALRRRVRRR